MQRAEVLIIGGGIIGLATGYRLLQRRPDTTVCILEKEPRLAQHQTGRNSGVLHSGIYYRPGSLKARTCREGRRALEQFCGREGIPFARCGKVIVAGHEAERARLESIYERGQANGVPCDLIGPTRLRDLEPHTAGIAAVHVPGAGIIDFTQVAERFAQRIRDAGGHIVTDARVTGIAPEASVVTVETTAGAFGGSCVVNCGGLHSDRLTRMSGHAPPARIVPFRGEFHTLRESARHLCNTLIYPVPHPSFPFLGAHFTRTLSGGVECGPNAVLAFAREGYRKRDLSLRDAVSALTYPGFLRLARRHWRVGVEELWRSYSLPAFVRALQRLVPALTAADLAPAPAGVRAQALRRNGTLVDDFLLSESARVINVCNAPSPAATASLSVADTIVDAVTSRIA